jgi:hypothetical protein
MRSSITRSMRPRVHTLIFPKEVMAGVSGVVLPKEVQSVLAVQKYQIRFVQ